MPKEVIMGLIEKIDCDQPDNCLKLFFSRRTASKYLSHNPSVSNGLQKEIIKTVFPDLKAQMNENALVQYNPIGVADREIENMLTTQIPLVNEFLESISDDKVYKDMNNLRIDKVGFYCIQLSVDGKDIYLFRQFQKLRKLRKGFLAQIVNNELLALENSFLGIDEAIDILLYEGEIYIFNHISLKRIFEYRDEFLQKTNEALGEILNKNVIANIEQFAEDCYRDIRITKRFTNIMTKGRLPLFFDNYDKVPEIVQDLAIDIDFDEDGKMIYREKSQLFHIINLLSDAYFRSLLANRPGIAKLEEEL